MTRHNCVGSAGQDFVGAGGDPIFVSDRQDKITLESEVKVTKDIIL